MLATWLQSVVRTENDQENGEPSRTGSSALRALACSPPGSAVISRAARPASVAPTCRIDPGPYQSEKPAAVPTNRAPGPSARSARAAGPAPAHG